MQYSTVLRFNSTVQISMPSCDSFRSLVLVVENISISPTNKSESRNRKWNILMETLWSRANKIKEVQTGYVGSISISRLHFLSRDELFVCLFALLFCPSKQCFCCLFCRDYGLNSKVKKTQKYFIGTMEIVSYIKSCYFR